MSVSVVCPFVVRFDRQCLEWLLVMQEDEYSISSDHDHYIVNKDVNEAVIEKEWVEDVNEVAIEKE